MTIGVGILAGGRGRRLKQGVPKAQAMLDGRPIWAYTCEAALDITMEQILMVVPTEKPIQHNQIKCLETRHSYMGDLFQLIEGAKERNYDRLLVINADSVLVTAKSLREFLKLTEGSEAGFIWPAIRRTSIPQTLQETVLNDLPGCPHLVRSGVMMFRPSLLHPNQHILNQMKRHPCFAEVYPLGAINCIMWALKLLNMTEVMRRMRKTLGCREVEMPELDIGVFGFDVDTPQELALAERYLTIQRQLRR